ncbi:MAG: ABC transporter permease [Solirubrobacterales bacterium]
MKKLSFFNIIIYLSGFFVFFPMAVLVLWGFGKRWPWPSVIPSEYSLRGVSYVVSTPNSINMVLFSIVLSAIVTIISLAISIPAGRALAMYEFKGKGFFKLLVLFPLVISPVATGLGIQVFFIKLGLSGTFIGVVLVHLVPCLPYGIRILTDVFKALGESMEQQARNLGAGKLQVLYYITLPLISKGLLSAGSLIFIVSFSQYFLTFIIGGGNVVTLSMLMFPFIQSGDRGIAACYSMVFIGITFIILLTVEKRIKSIYLSENNFYI